MWRLGKKYEKSIEAALTVCHFYSYSWRYLLYCFLDFFTNEICVIYKLKLNYSFGVEFAAEAGATEEPGPVHHCHGQEGGNAYPQGQSLVSDAACLT